MRVCVIGTGYVGLVSGTCFSDMGHQVSCVDTDAAKIGCLRAGHIPIYEPGLALLIERNMRAGRLSFTTECAPAIREAEVVLIAVGTPRRAGDGSADLSCVFEATRQVAREMAGFTVVVLKSTIPVGTSSTVEYLIRQIRPDADFAVISNPEFLREGAAIDDFMQPDRIVIGTENERARLIISRLYQPLHLGRPSIVFTTPKTSELIKYVSNAYLAMKISFINEIADLCEAIGTDVKDVAYGVGLDHRIGHDFLNAGPGFGGSCFVKDTHTLLRTAQSVAARLQLIEAVVKVNERRKAAMAKRIIAACDGDVRGMTIAVLGLTFKACTDDLRDAPSLKIIPKLQKAGASIRAFDPEGMPAARKCFTGVTFASDPYECADGADLLVILTEWEQFRVLDLERLRSALTRPVIVDLRNIYQPAEMRKRGFRYVSIGRQDVDAEKPTQRIAPAWREIEAPRLGSVRMARDSSIARRSATR